MSSEKSKDTEAKPVKGRTRRGTNKKGNSRSSSPNQKDLSKEQGKGPEVVAAEGSNISDEQPSASGKEPAQTTRKRRSPRRPKTAIERPIPSDKQLEHVQQKESIPEKKTSEEMATQSQKEEQRKPRARKTSGNRVRSRVSKIRNSSLVPESSEDSTKEPEATEAPNKKPIQQKQVKSEISETE